MPARWCVSSRHGEQEEYAVEQADSYARQLGNFAAAIAGRSQPVVPLVQSVVKAYVTEALITSLLQRRSVEVDLADRIAADYRSCLEERGKVGRRIA